MITITQRVNGINVKPVSFQDRAEAEGYIAKRIQTFPVAKMSARVVDAQETMYIKLTNGLVHEFELLTEVN